MSSVFQDKSPQELEGKLEIYIENYLQRVGEEFTQTDLINRLTKKIEERKQAYFESVYGTCSVTEMKTLILLLERQLKQQDQFFAANNTQQAKKPSK